MNTFRITTITLATAALLAGCNEYELEGSAIRAFKTAYDKNFINNVGDIDPNQSWDFSTAGGNRGKAAVTRAVKLNGDGWYYPEDQTLEWMHEQLTEQHDNSGLCKDFYLTWTPGMSFQIVPIYEGYAKMQWKLFMKVTSAEDGTSLYDQEIWSKGDNVQLKTQPAPTSSKTNWQYEEDEICVWFEMYYSDGQVSIWPYTDDGNSGKDYTGADFGATQMQYIGQRNNKSVYKWTCSKKTSEISLPTKVIFKVNNDEWGAIDFRNHGYYHENKGTWSDEDGGNPGSPVQKYTPEPTPDPVWSDFDDLDDAANAQGFRAKPITITEPNDGTSDPWPLGSIVSFYLKITDNKGLDGCAENGDIMSTLNHQIVYLDVPAESKPTNVDSGDGVITFILGCEDSNRNGYYYDLSGKVKSKNYPREKDGSVNNLIQDWGKSDWDYNDVVFLINGVMPKPVVIDQNPSASTVPVEKRYMAEDLTNTGDMDFNDIVVDVKSVRWTYWRVNTSTNEKEVDISYNGTYETTDGQTLTFTNGICDVQTATVQHLCGTIPIRFQVGTTLLPWITDPTNLDQSVAQLNRTFEGTPNYGTGSESTQGIDPKVTLDVTGWDPKTNNVVVYAGWDALNGVATKPDVDSEGNFASFSEWYSVFPKPGTVPCIIATDVKDRWTAECVDITETPWWHDNFISTKH